MDTSLTPPFIILDHAQILREILVVYESSLGDSSSLRATLSPKSVSSSSVTSAEHQELAAEGCSAILDRMVDPAVEMCVLAADEKHRLRPSWDKEVFIINVLSYLQVRLTS